MLTAPLFSIPSYIQRCSAGMKPPLARTEKPRGRTATFRFAQTSPDTFWPENDEPSDTPPAATPPLPPPPAGSDKESDAKTGARDAAIAATIAPQRTQQTQEERRWSSSKLSEEIRRYLDSGLNSHPNPHYGMSVRCQKTPNSSLPKPKWLVCVCFASSVWKRFLVPIHILIHIPF